MHDSDLQNQLTLKDFFENKNYFNSELLRVPAPPYAAILLYDQIILNRHVILHRAPFTLIKNAALTHVLICLQMSPPDNLQSEALAAIVAHYRWTNMAIIVEKSDYGRQHYGIK